MLFQSQPVARRSAFTLIELLVVIAILAAILFPVFAQAEAAAKQSVCLSNEKQLGTAVQLYLNDDDQYPGALPAIAQPPGIVGDGPLMPFDLQLMPYVRNTAIFLCPGDGGARLSPPGDSPFWDLTYKKKAFPRSYHYVGGINTVEAGGHDRNTGMSDVSVPAARSVGIPASGIERPSETITHIEAWAAGACWASTPRMWDRRGTRPTATATPGSSRAAGPKGPPRATSFLPDARYTIPTNPRPATVAP